MSGICLSSCFVFSKTYPSSLTIKEGFFESLRLPFQRELHLFPQASSSEGGGCNRSYSELSFRKPTSPPLTLREGPPLISVFSPQGRRGNRPTRCSIRFAIRLADHQRSSPAAELHFAVCDRMDTNRLRAACWVLAYGLLDAGWVLIPVCLILACLVLDA